MLPSQAKSVHDRSVAEADALVDELVAPFVETETRPMRLRREREEARSAFDARVAARVAESRERHQEHAPKLTQRGPSAVPAPDLMAAARRIFAEDIVSETSASPVPYVLRSPEEHEQMTLAAAVDLGLVEPKPEPPEVPEVEDDSEAEPAVEPGDETPGEDAPEG